MDFLRPDLIQTDLSAASFADAVRRLSEHLVAAHGLETDAGEVCRSALAREAQASTCLGAGLAVPHCVLPAGLDVHAVLGLLRPPLQVPTPDQVPVSCMVLLATSEDRRLHHLEVLATIARMIGTDVGVQERLYSARTPAEAWAVLDGQ